MKPMVVIRRNIQILDTFSLPRIYHRTPQMVRFGAAAWHGNDIAGKQKNYLTTTESSERRAGF